MVLDLRSALPVLLPKASAWVATQSQNIIATGTPLTADQLVPARCVGVAQPERIRIKVVPSLPMPDDVELRMAAIQTGLLGPDMAAITLEYGIYVCKGHENSGELIAHECRHVYQYQELGSINNFLATYLPQIVAYGYWDAPLETDARRAAAGCV